MTPPGLYFQTISYLATQGYLIMASRSELRPFPSHPQFALDLQHCLDFLERENLDAGSIWFGTVDIAALGAAGHSMGGGAAILAAAEDVRIKAVCVLAPANTWPVSSVEEIGKIRVPLRIVAASADGLTPLPVHALPHFWSSTAPSQIVVIPEGTHCGFLDLPIPPPFCDSPPGESGAQRIAAQGLAREFFDVHLKGNRRLWSRVWGPAIAFDISLLAAFRPGVQLTPAVQRSLTGAEKETAGFRLTLRHAFPDAIRVDILAWRGGEPVAVTPPTTPLLPPGQAFPFRFTVERGVNRDRSALVTMAAIPTDGLGAGAYAFGLDCVSSSAQPGMVHEDLIDP
jgi:dienelactone hydrolase